MKLSRPKHLSTEPPATATPAAHGLIRSWVNFWFTPIDPTGLHAVRVLAGLLFLAWLLPLAGQVDSFFGAQGWFDRQAYTDAARRDDIAFQRPPWSIFYLCGSNSNLLAAAYWGTIAVVVLFTLGLWTRLTGVLTWVAVASFASNPIIESDADVLLTILAFYLMIGYVFFEQRNQSLSWISRLLGSRTTWLWGRSTGPDKADPQPSVAANLALRLLQVHFAIVIVTTGLHKLQFGDWWGGYALWFPLHPPLETTLQAIRQYVPEREFYLGVLSIAAYAILAWEIGFPAFAWRPRWRPLLLGGAAVGWLGSAFIWRLPMWGPAVVVFSLCYLSPGEWQRVLGWLTRVPGLQRLTGWMPVALDERDEPGKKSVGTASLVSMGQR
jgi:hypothetical protein